MKKSSLGEMNGARRPRILFVAESVSLSHVARPAVLARWAREAGYEVHFACGPAYANVARGEGFEPLPIKTIPNERFYGRLRAGTFFYTQQELESYVAAEDELIRRTKPDLIAGDFRLTLDLSAARAGVPLLALQNAHWNPASICRFSPPNAGFFKLLPLALREQLFALLRPVAFRTFAAPLNAVRQAHGLPALADFRQHYTAGRWCAYLDLQDLYPLERPLPAGHFFLGPVPWKPAKTSSGFRVPGSELTTNLEPRTTNRVVYVTLGSSGEAGVLPEVLRTLAAAGCEVVLSGVSEREAEGLRAEAPGLNGRLHIAGMVDPSNILRHAALTVCPGGSGTVYQSLAAGVPLLCLPSNPDQGLVAAAVEAQGAGLVLAAECARGRKLDSTLNELLNAAAYGERARELAAALERHDTRGRWLAFLANALPPSHAAPPASARQHPVAPALAEVTT